MKQASEDIDPPAQDEPTIPPTRNPTIPDNGGHGGDEVSLACPHCDEVRSKPTLEQAFRSLDMHHRLDHASSLKPQDYGLPAKAISKTGAGKESVRVEPIDVRLDSDERERVSSLRRRSMVTQEELRSRRLDDEYDRVYGPRALDARSELDVGERIGRSEAESQSQKRRIADLEDELRDRDKAEEDAEDSENEEISDLARQLERKDELILQTMKQAHETQMAMMQQAHEREMESAKQIREAELGKFKAEMQVELEKIKGESKSQSMEQAVIHQGSKAIERIADVGEKLAGVVITGNPMRPLSESPTIKSWQPRVPGEIDVADLMDPQFVDHPLPDFRELEAKRRREAPPQ